MKLGKFMLACLTLLALNPIFAQNFSARWKKVDDAIKKDLPKTALAEIRSIYHIAAQQGNTGEMLKAAISATTMQNTISNDSLTTELERIDSVTHSEKRPTEHALWMLVSANMYYEHSSYNNKDNGDKAVARLLEATKNLDIFKGEKAEKYVPAISKGKDAKYFGNDLVNVVCRNAISRLKDNHNDSYTYQERSQMRRDLEHRFINCYRANGNNDAILLATLDSIKNDNNDYICKEYADTLKSAYNAAKTLAEQYASNPCAVEAYIYMCECIATEEAEMRTLKYQLAKKGADLYSDNPRAAILRNMMKSLKEQEFHTETDNRLLFPGEKIKGTVSFNNIRQPELNLYPTTYTARQIAENSKLIKEFKAAGNSKTTLYSGNITGNEDIFSKKDSFECNAPQKTGVYIMKLSDSKSQESNIAIYISNIRLLFFPLPGNKMRITVVEARSGKPISGAKVNEYSETPKLTLVNTYTTDKDGTVTVARGKHSYVYNAESGDDKFSPVSRCYGYANFAPRKVMQTTEYRLFSDRAVYRPSQKVHIAGIVFQKKDEECSTIYDHKVKISVKDSQNREIYTQETTSDEFGTFSADIMLPSTIMPGNLRITANATSSIYVKVEEYKRPTFEVKTDKPQEKYAMGDTVSVKGHALAFTGVGMQGAKVTYEVKRRSFWLFRRNSSNDEVFRDTTITDSNGEFTMRVPLVADNANANALDNISYYFSVNATVTSAVGESQNAGTTIIAGKRAALIGCDISDKVDKEMVSAITFTLQNLMRENIDGKGTYTIEKSNGTVCAKGDFVANTPVKIATLSSLASGKYVIHTKFEGESDSIYDIKKEFLLFSINDKQPADSTERIRLYSQATSFEQDALSKIQFGTSFEGVTAFYDIIANGQVVESKQISLSNNIVSETYTYKKEYGDGISVSLAFVKDGVLYSKNISIKKPVPDKRLRYKWTSFRDRLRPNQKEEWRLQILNPDGTPAKASAVAAIYDASLDKFAKNYWNSSLFFGKYIPAASWSTYKENSYFNYQYNPAKYEKSPSLSFDNLLECPTFIQDARFTGHIGGLTRLGKSSLKVSNYSLAEANAPKMLTIRGNAEEERLAADVAANETGSADTDNGQNANNIKPRENFTETAYFAPALRTDENGNLTISFTAPESLTRWNVKLLAHTKSMNLVEADTTATVTKDFMIQSNLPRFLRIGDAATIPATIKNISTKPLAGKATMTICDAQSLAVIKQSVVKFSVSANGETVVAFPFNVDENISSPLLICKIIADCGEFSDGEQHYLPVFSDKTEVIEALPFTLENSGNHTVNIAEGITGKKAGTTNRRLTIEYTSNPTWLALQALPKIDSPKYDDALTLAAALYAASLEHEIAYLSPEIKQAAKKWANEQTADTLLQNALLRNPDLKNILLAETPWAVDADNISLRRRELSHVYDEVESGMKARNLEERLTRQQNQDGGFGWFAGMPSSQHITTKIATILLRLNGIMEKPCMKLPTQNAVKYLDKQVAKQIEEMKKNEKRGFTPNIWDSHLAYLNIMRMNPGKASAQAVANRKYLLAILAKHYSELNMEDKSTAALVLADMGYDKEAKTALQSVLEHTVSDKDKGIYFDSFRAPSYWNSYKIPTQVAALEAVRALEPNDKATQNGMLKWILQEKRTQGWLTTLNTLEATYALLSTTKTDTTLLHFNTKLPDAITLNMQNGEKTNVMKAAKTVDEDATGYIRADFRLDNLKSSPVSISISKNDGGISWGGIYGRYLAPAATVENGGKELTVKREYFVVENGKEKTVTPKTIVNVGDLIRVRYTVNALRDYDYVSLVDPRPACLEPTKQISGYTCDNGEWFYLAVRDASQVYFLEKLEKGSHIFSMDFRIDRKGTYLAAPASIQCLYSPEFTGHSKGLTINSTESK